MRREFNKNIIEEYLLEHKIPDIKIPSKYMEFEVLKIKNKWGSNADDPKEIYKKNNNKKYFKIYKKNQPILDIGCGQGYFVEALSKNNIKCVGIDLSYIDSELAKHARIDKRTKKVFYDPKVKRSVYRGFAYKLPFKDKSFGMAIFAGVLMMIPFSKWIIKKKKLNKKEKIDLAIKTLKEINRVLKKEGILMMATYSNESPKIKHYLNLTEKELRKVLLISGFYFKESDFNQFNKKTEGWKGWNVIAYKK